MSEQETRPKALFLVKPKTMSREDIERIQTECGIVVAECEEPDAVRALEPSLSANADAVLQASWRTLRWILYYEGAAGTQFAKHTVTETFVKLLLNSYVEQPTPVQKVQKVRHSK
jgi:hypothetical protein